MLILNLRRNKMYKKVISIIILVLCLIACSDKSNTEKNINNVENIEQNSKIYTNDIKNIKIEKEKLTLNAFNEIITEKNQIEKK